MKWLLVLFATYMLVLPCIPCGAAEVCCEEEQACVVEGSSCVGEDDCTSEEDPRKDCPSEEDQTPDHSRFPEEDQTTDHSCPSEKDHEHTPTCPCCPSFSCNTCHSLVVSANLVLEEPSIPILNVANISFADESLANFSSAIWQPPKVSSL